MKDSRPIVIYLRHCGERTVPLLKWYFRDHEIVEINGTGISFGEVFLRNLQLMESRAPHDALVSDGDLVPLGTLEETIKRMIGPLRNPAVRSANGNRVDRFISRVGLATGGFHSYRSEIAAELLKIVDVQSDKPESSSVNRVGGYYQDHGHWPLVGHEYGQFHRHLYWKAYQRSAKSKQKPVMRVTGTDEDGTYALGLTDGEKAVDSHLPYRLEESPHGMLERAELTSGIPEEWSALRQSALADAAADLQRLPLPQRWFGPVARGMWERVRPRQSVS